MGDPLPLVILYVMSLFACALFSFVETSVTALRLFKLKELSASCGKRYRFFFTTLENNPQMVLITILIISCLADVVAGTLATNLSANVFSHFELSSNLGWFLGVCMGTLSILIFGEIIPKNLAQGGGERLFRSTLWLTNLIFLSLYPLVLLIIRGSNFISFHLFGKRAFDSNNEWVASEKEIQFLIQHITQKGMMEAEKTEMLENVFELGEIPVKEIMIPSTDVVSVDVTTPIANTLQIFSKHPFTRLPVYENKPDNIIGMLHLKDVFLLLSTNEAKPLREICRPISFVPESVRVNQLLREFRDQHIHIAMVVDEYGNISGLITLEDVLEEIVGEIVDEHEPKPEKIVALPQGGWLVDGRTPLEEISKKLNIDFGSHDANTIGGFLTEYTQHLPQQGDQIHYENFYFHVQKANMKYVQQVLIFDEKQASSQAVNGEE